MKKIKVVSCVVSIAIMALIFFFSSQPASQSDTVSMGIAEKVVQIIAKVINEPPDNIRDGIHVFIRKLAHFSLYFALAFSMFYSVLKPGKISGARQMWIAFGICVLYALSDEIHQSFVPGRACMAKDVLIDSSGALLGCFAARLIQVVLIRRAKR